MRLISAVLAVGLCVQAQDGLHVDVVSGNDVIVTAASGRGADIRVRVLDREQKPVKGATVSAVLPARGVGGHFRDGGTIATTQTDSDGTADFRGIRLRRTSGEFATRILARRGDRTGAADVRQTVSMAPDSPEGKFSRKRLIMLAIAGAGVAAGVVAAMYGDSGPAPTTGMTVTPGSPTTTGPR
jgi:hypothetical protein